MPALWVHPPWEEQAFRKPAFSGGLSPRRSLDCTPQAATGIPVGLRHPLSPPPEASSLLVPWPACAHHAFLDVSSSRSPLQCQLDTLATILPDPPAQSRHGCGSNWVPCPDRAWCGGLGTCAWVCLAKTWCREPKDVLGTQVPGSPQGPPPLHGPSVRRGTLGPSAAVLKPGKTHCL